ncbi:Leaf rust 10 disease-resistance locus receptor-like protein kinase [Actinidia chinensis var. chinensis]|uniref:Leaf rust 10 disease-resistance locus receptor-like protein kinase n=1 Tax=Actinidia chinensis var. chinensis TaxID=1590841 RepID=A0A2R6PH03_ACTCC|nr:Leaf rust 10 disease-resistance locus receptor-like protein kinase [Actinidia chinensis var. chinensis]
MAVPSILPLALFVVSHLLLPPSAAGEDHPHHNHCPKSFYCASHGPIKFPFSNNSYSHCGLFTVRCNESIPKLNLGVKDQWYNTTDKFQGNEIRVKDKLLDLLINTTSCDVFSFYLNWTLRPTHLVSFTISPSLTLFKCTSINSQLDQQKADHFRGNHNYRVFTGLPRVSMLEGEERKKLLDMDSGNSCSWNWDYSNPNVLLHHKESSTKYSYSDIKKITNSFRDKLGQGGYGFVFKGKLENGSLVAVKVLQGLKGCGEEFINEVATISRTSHVNVVTLLGYCFEGRHRALIYEFMPNGSLDKFIYVGNSLTYHQLGWEALYKIAVGIARGLEYLHRGCNTRILHFDIKPHNVLLDEDFCPKISDFGLAKLCPKKESVVSLLGARGTAGYIAPEVFCRNFGDVSHKSDVYSFGMMVLEMVGGRKNIDAEAERTSEIYFPHWVYKRLELEEELGLHGIMNDEANESARKIVIVGLWCIQTDPLHRPSMSRVVEMLEGSLDSLQIPPKPYLSSPSRSPVADSSNYAPVVTS